MYAFFETSVLTLLSLAALYILGARAYAAGKRLINKNEIENEKKCSCCK